MSQEHFKRRRQWHPSPLFLPGKSQGQENLVGCRLWGRTELDMMKRLSSSTSRLPFPNIAHSPETVPPPTVFLQLSAPNLISGSTTFEEFFGLLLINSVTDGPMVRHRYSSYMFTAAGDSRVGGREQAEPPQAGDPPFWVEISWVPGTG